MKKLIILFDFFVLVFSIQLCVHCSAETPPSSKVEGTNKQEKIDPADIEVIKDLDMLRNWDIVGPEGPDLNDSGILNAQITTGASHAK